MGAHHVARTQGGGARRSAPNVTLERTPLAALAAAPHLPACMPGSKTLFTPSSDSLLACHKRKLAAGVTLNSSRYASRRNYGGMSKPF